MRTDARHSATERYRVRSYEVDAQGRLAPSALCNYLQESAGLHARELGVSLEQLQAQGMTWFLWRLHVWVDRWPEWGQTVAVETWPSAVGRPYVMRDFRIRLEGGPEDAVESDDAVEIGVATSAWLLMDVESKRPIRRMPESVRGLHPETPRRALDDAFRRLPLVDEDSEPSTASLRVRRSDLDLNGHLNHVASIAALLEAVPAEVVEACRLQSLEVEFKGEGHVGDPLTSICDSGYHHSLVRRGDGKELARGRSRWTRPPTGTAVPPGGR